MFYVGILHKLQKCLQNKLRKVFQTKAAELDQLYCTTGQAQTEFILLLREAKSPIINATVS